MEEKEGREQVMHEPFVLIDKMSEEETLGEELLTEVITIYTHSSWTSFIFFSLSFCVHHERKYQKKKKFKRVEEK